ncbi:MAG: lamin tail domain-containing protein [Candidatus Kerfeldbacteria bacterium]|nr:lamin tail domain-containing protein [Candidatus Kerfeldbacteria bacterium]
MAVCGWLLAFSAMALGGRIFTSLIPAATQADTPPVVINELMWMGSSASSADEWIELRNLTSQPVDLANWKLTKKSSGVEAAMVIIPAGATVGPNGFFLISNYAETNTNSVLSVTPDLVTTDVALANTALQIKLYDQSGTVIDTADDGSGNPLAGNYESSGTVFASMERNLVPGDGTMAGSWHTARISLGFRTGRTEQGTPRAANSNALPVAEAGADQTGVVGQDLNFDGSDSFDPDGQALTFNWDFGDGTSSGSSTPAHVWAAAGGNTVTLTVSDGVDSASDTAAVTIAQPPAAAPSLSPSPPTPEPSLPEAPPASNPPPATPTSCQGARLSELLPNPVGSDDGEFIELENATGQAVELGGCQVWVNDRRVYTFPDGEQVTAPGFYRLDKSTSRLTLTNSGAVVRLVDTDGQELDETEYGKSAEGSSWARFGNSWGWTDQVTPGATNREPVEPETAASEQEPSGQTPSQQKSKGQDNSRDPESRSARTVTLGEIQDVEIGTLISVRGTVTTPVGALGARVTYIEDDSGAVSLLLSAEGIQPAVGDLAEVEGTVRSYQGRKRVSVKKDDLKIIRSGEVVDPKSISLDDLTVELADQLVQIQGVVSTSRASAVEIDDGSASATVYLKSSTGIVKPKLSAGDTLRVVGIVNAVTSGLRVLPRTQDDLRIERVLGVTTSQAAKPTQLPTTSARQAWWYWLMVGLGLAAAAAKPAWEAWKRRGLKIKD